MKYRLTEETKVVNGVTLHRIEYIKAFADIQVGDKGGWIEKEDNLSQDGNACVYGDACVYDYAHVYGDARIYGDAYVYGNARVCGDAWVSGDARVFGNAYVSNMRFHKTAQVEEYCKVIAELQEKWDSEEG